MTSLSIPELCKLSSLRNSWRAIILAGRLGRDKLGDKLRNKGDKTSGRRAHHPTKGNKKEDKLGDNLGDKLEDSWKTSWETRQTRPREGGHTIQQRETRRKTNWHTSWETSWKTSWKTSWETRQTRPREGGHTIQQRETRRKTNWYTSWETSETRTREGRGKADTPSNKGKQEGTNWETSWEADTPSKKGKQEWKQAGRQAGEGGKGDKASGRRRHHPTQAHMWQNNERKSGHRPRSPYPCRRPSVVTQGYSVVTEG